MKKYILLYSIFLLTFLGCDSSQRQIEPKTVTESDSDVLSSELLPTVTKIKNDEKLASENEVKQFCHDVQKSFNKYGWGKSSCLNKKWKIYGKSKENRPLLWTDFGVNNHQKELVEVTLLMCGVHGDEITPIKFCFDSIDYIEGLEKGMELDSQTGKAANFKGKYVIIVPIVTPDSFFKKYPSRINANGVDINRNFPTKDFDKTAVNIWKNEYKSDKRRFPGMKAMSEIETAFQVHLIQKYRPDKIISVHSPLTLLDYDGPVDLSSGGSVGPRANQLLIQMSQGANGYKIKNYPFFPGSLGNYAGNERNIPTYTLELPSSDNRNHKLYWSRFKPSIYSAVMHKISRPVDLALKPAHEHDEDSHN